MIELSDSSFNQAGLRRELGPRIAVVHELSHYWDWKTGGLWSRIKNSAGNKVSGLVAFIGQESAPTAYGRTNTQEDWAESVAMYVYPQYAKIIQSEGDPLEVNFAPGRPGLGSWSHDLCRSTLHGAFRRVEMTTNPQDHLTQPSQYCPLSTLLGFLLVVVLAACRNTVGSSTSTPAHDLCAFAHSPELLLGTTDVAGVADWVKAAYAVQAEQRVKTEGDFAHRRILLDGGQSPLVGQRARWKTGSGV